MQRVSTSTAVATRPTPATGGTPGYFSEGNPSSGAPATVPGQDWFNAVQEEVVNVIQGAGLTPSPLDLGQMLKAIRAIIGQQIRIILPNRQIDAALGAGGSTRVNCATFTAPVAGTIIAWSTLNIDSEPASMFSFGVYSNDTMLAGDTAGLSQTQIGVQVVASGTATVLNARLFAGTPAPNTNASVSVGGIFLPS